MLFLLLLLVKVFFAINGHASVCVCCALWKFPKLKCEILNTVWANTRINWKIKPLHAERCFLCFFLRSLSVCLGFVLFLVFFVAVHLANDCCLFTFSCECVMVEAHNLFFATKFSFFCAIRTPGEISFCFAHTPVANNKLKTTIECYFVIVSRACARVCVCSIDDIQYIFKMYRTNTTTCMPMSLEFYND